MVREGDLINVSKPALQCRSQLHMAMFNFKNVQKN